MSGSNRTTACNVSAGLFAWVVGRIHVGECEGTLTVHLHDGLLRSPGVVIHVRRRFTKTSRAKFDPLLFVKLVTHSDMEFARDDRHVLGCRMIVRRDLVV